jgi:hypothetical protein
MIAGRKQAGCLNKGQKELQDPWESGQLTGSLASENELLEESEKASFRLEIFGCKVGQCGLFPDWLIWVLHGPLPTR